MAFELPQLNYSYDALEPHIDARTMEIHHSKHHNGYTNNLNAAIAGTKLETKSIESILEKLDMENKVVRNNSGGFHNHSLFLQNIQLFEYPLGLTFDLFFLILKLDFLRLFFLYHLEF